MRVYSPKENGKLKSGGDGHMPQVSCSVSNCHYWEENNRCNADAILIEIDRHANRKFDTEFAEGLDTKHRDKAENAAATCCHTFKAKDAKS